MRSLPSFTPSAMPPIHRDWAQTMVTRPKTGVFPSNTRKSRFLTYFYRFFYRSLPISSTASYLTEQQRRRQFYRHLRCAMRQRESASTQCIALDIAWVNSNNINRIKQSYYTRPLHKNLDKFFVFCFVWSLTTSCWSHVLFILSHPSLLHLQN